MDKRDEVRESIADELTKIAAAITNAVNAAELPLPMAFAAIKHATGLLAGQTMSEEELNEAAECFEWIQKAFNHKVVPYKQGKG